MKAIAIIPARGGSKRLPNKNILPLAGKPLIGWTIEAAVQSGKFDTVLVSTDSEKIREEAIRHGAEAPFLRPAAISGDTSGSFEVLEHTLEFYKGLGREFDVTVLLQPTSPLRDHREVSLAMELLNANKADSVISVTECDHSPLWSNTLPEDHSLKEFLRPEVKGKRSQDLPKFYRLNGAIYAYRTKELLRRRQLFFDENIFAHVMPKLKSVDIDSQLDFVIAEAILSSFS